MVLHINAIYGQNTLTVWYYTSMLYMVKIKQSDSTNTANIMHAYMR